MGRKLKLSRSNNYKSHNRIHQKQPALSQTQPTQTPAVSTPEEEANASMLIEDFNTGNYDVLDIDCLAATVLIATTAPAVKQKSISANVSV
jgi:hypothetical protein